MDKITHEIRLSCWKKVIEQCNARPESMTAKNWLKEQEITEEAGHADGASEAGG